MIAFLALGTHQCHVYHSRPYYDFKVIHLKVTRCYKSEFPVLNFWCAHNLSNLSRSRNWKQKFKILPKGTCSECSIFRHCFDKKNPSHFRSKINLFHYSFTAALIRLLVLQGFLMFVFFFPIDLQSKLESEGI